MFVREQKNINQYCISTVINKNIAIKNTPIAINIFALYA